MAYLEYSITPGAEVWTIYQESPDFSVIRQVLDYAVSDAGDLWHRRCFYHLRWIARWAESQHLTRDRH